MRYHPRIQTAALKVGFHALLLHKYSKRFQTYSIRSWVLLLKMLDGKFFNSLLFKYLSKINCMVYKNRALIERPKVNPQLLHNNLYMGLSHFSFSFFFFLNFLSLRPKENIYRKIETQTWVLNHIEYSWLVNEAI